MITLTREEAQQVLDALNKGIRRNDWKPVCDAHNEMKMRLAQPEPKKALVMRGQKDKVVAIYRENDEDIIRAEMPHEEILRARLAQPEPEPVAWMYEFGTDNADAVNEIRWYKNVHLTKPSGMVRNVVPLYTAPPQREWQGMTDEEMFDCLAQTDGEAKRLPLGFKWFAEAIEAKLKEKNT